MAKITTEPGDVFTVPKTKVVGLVLLDGKALIVKEGGRHPYELSIEEFPEENFSISSQSEQHVEVQMAFLAVRLVLNLPPFNVE